MYKKEVKDNAVMAMPYGSDRGRVENVVGYR